LHVNCTPLKIHGELGGFPIDKHELLRTKKLLKFNIAIISSFPVLLKSTCIDRQDQVSRRFIENLGEVIIAT
jgi:hypothetical protein